MAEASTNTDNIQLPVRQHPPAAILKWIGRGWQDVRKAGWPSILHGLIVSIVSIVIAAGALIFWQVLPGAMSGFVLVGPILATGLYALSYRIESGGKATLKDSIDSWKSGSRCLIGFGLILIIIGTLWVIISVVLFYLFVDADINTPLDFLRYVVTQGDHLFLLWAIFGGMVSAIVFAMTVVSVPLLIDRDITTPDALMTSMRAVGENPVTMVLWAMFILFATGLSVVTFMLGFILLYPLMGHASWHAYRDLVDSSSIAEKVR